MNIFKCFKKEEPVMEPEPTPVMEVVSSHIEHPQPPEHFILKIGSKRVGYIEKNKDTDRWLFIPKIITTDIGLGTYVIKQIAHDFTQEEIEMILEKLKELNNGQK